jgi:hypothetical protein
MAARAHSEESPFRDGSFAGQHNVELWIDVLLAVAHLPRLPASVSRSIHQVAGVFPDKKDSPDPFHPNNTAEFLRIYASNESDNSSDFLSPVGGLVIVSPLFSGKNLGMVQNDVAEMNRGLHA